MIVLDRLGRRLARWLNAPRPSERRVGTTYPGLLARTIRPGDVLLVEGSSRISAAIKYLTQSSWSHATLCIAPPVLGAAAGHEPPILLEVDVSEGVRLVPLERYATQHTRICRPVGLDADETDLVIHHAVARVGQRYDMKNIWDLARYLIPHPPVPRRWRRRLLAFGSGDPTRAICSSLIAEAFHDIGYPILPDIRVLVKERGGRDDAREVLHIRHHSLFTPRDFDVSPYFAIIKPTLEAGFDPHGLRVVRDTMPQEEPA